MTKGQLITGVAACLLAACAPLLPAVVSPKTVTTSAFPYPGLYSGALANGTLTYLMNADGTGRSCFRNSLSGRVALGDVAYDGRALYTEDGTFQVDAISPASLRLSAPYLQADLRRISDTPTVCTDFFQR